MAKVKNNSWISVWVTEWVMMPLTSSGSPRGEAGLELHIMNLICGNGKYRLEMYREVRTEIQIWLLPAFQGNLKQEQKEKSALSDTAEKFNSMKIFKRPPDWTTGKSPMTSSRLIPVDVGRVNLIRVELECEE